MSDCQNCKLEHLCVYEYKPCDCVQQRKYREAPDVVQCPACCGEGYDPYPIGCRICHTSGHVRRSALDNQSRMVGANV